jgi:hypothetical protein
MKEYSQLWSFAFHYSLLDHQWLSALEAIMSNPRREVQSMEFKKLVLTMVEACVFGSILEFIPIAGNSIDFFELAVDSLTDGATSSLITNVYYSGCLFASCFSEKLWMHLVKPLPSSAIIDSAKRSNMENHTKKTVTIKN